MFVARFSIALALLPLLACAPKGTRPHDMGVDAHEAKAAEADASSVHHTEQYDPAARAPLDRCEGGKGGRICWTEMNNPTEGHLREAAAMSEMAAKHREASAALRLAEESACAGIAPADRDISPFHHTADIVGVEPLTRMGEGKPAPHQTLGAIVTVQAVPGLTTEWLQRVVDCHIARNESLGNPVSEDPNCPLVPKGVSAKVSSTGAGFAVEIRASDEAVGAEVLVRAERLLPTRAP